MRWFPTLSVITLVGCTAAGQPDPNITGCATAIAFAAAGGLPSVLAAAATTPACQALAVEIVQDLIKQYTGKVVPAKAIRP